MATATSLEFDKLPLVEAAVRFSFDSALEVDFRAAQAVLDKVTKFDNLDLPSQIEVPPGIENALLVVGPNVPNAFSLTGHAQGITLTLQRQLLAAKWQRTPESAEYPRYDLLRESLSELCKAMPGSIARVAVVNIVYVNFIPTKDVGARFIQKYFGEVAQVGLFKDAARVQQFTAAWRASPTIDLRVDLRHAVRNKADGQRLLTAGGSRIQPEDDPFSRLDEVHDELQRCFLELISDEAKREWGYRETRANEPANR